MLFLPLTVVILILDNFFPGARIVTYIKFITIFSLFLSACLLKKRYLEQVIINTAVFFALIGEFFLNIYDFLAPDPACRSAVFGALGFMLAYGLLIIVFNRGAGRGGITAAVPVLVISLPVLIILYPHISAYYIWGALLFALVLCCMTWCSMRTLFGVYYSPWASRCMALSGLLLLISDSGVAMAMFHPLFAGHFIPLLANIIWAAYVPAWTLLVFVMAGLNCCPPGHQGFHGFRQRPPLW